MNKEELEIILKECDATPNVWVTLDRVGQIILYQDGTIYNKPLVRQFYFDMNNELLYVRKTKGTILTNVPESVLSTRNDIVAIPYKGKTAVVELEPGGLLDETLNTRIHEMYPFSQIAAFTNY